MARFLSTLPAVKWQKMTHNLAALGSYYSEAQLAIKGSGGTRLKRALEVLEFHSAIDPTNDYNQIVFIIKEKLEQ